MPDAIVIAGPDGAGKTTFARQAGLSLYSPAFYLNADEIQREPGSPHQPLSAGREFLLRLDLAVKDRLSFMVETTLSSSNYARNLVRWRRAGFHLILHFIELPSADYAVARVAMRAANGGHSIPEADVRRRFERGIRIFQAIESTVDEWYHWTSDDAGMRFRRHYAEVST